MNSDECPLHAANSTHGEEQFFETVWGPVPVLDAGKRMAEWCGNLERQVSG